MAKGSFREALTLGGNSGEKCLCCCSEHGCWFVPPCCPSLCLCNQLWPLCRTRSKALKFVNRLSQRSDGGKQFREGQPAESRVKVCLGDELGELGLSAACFAPRLHVCWGSILHKEGGGVWVDPPDVVLAPGSVRVVSILLAFWSFIQESGIEKPLRSSRSLRFRLGRNSFQ